MYTGNVVEIPIGSEGLTGSKNPTGLHPGYLLEATNISYYDGTLRKEGGAAKYNASAISGAPTILGGFDHRTNALAQRMVVACNDGKLYKDSGTGTFPVTLKSGLSASMRPFFVQAGKEAAAGNRKLFIFTGTNVVQVLADDGATTADISAPPTDWAGANQPTFGLLHAYRMLAGGNANDPHRIYYSTQANHEDFTSAGTGTIAVYPGEGDALVGGISFNNYAIVFKRPAGIYALDLTDLTAPIVRRVNRSVGLASPWAMAQTDSDVIFMDCVGNIQSLVNSLTNADVEGRNLDQDAFLEPLLRTELSTSRLNQVKAAYYVTRREVHFAYTTIAGSINNSRLVLDLYRPDKIRYRISPRDVCEALWLRRDSNGIDRVMVGDNAGFVWQLDQPTRNKAGAAYSSRAKTVPTDLSFADNSYGHRVKNAEFLELVYEPTSFNMVNVELEWDGRPRQTVGFHLQSSGAILGTSFVLGNAILGSSAYQTTRRRLVGGGKLLSLTFSNNARDQDFSIARARLYFNLANE
jgi:hypothetical protein